MAVLGSKGYSIGHIAEISPGATFEDRRRLHDAGVHVVTRARACRQATFMIFW
jgi:hypothetical protein